MKATNQRPYWATAIYWWRHCVDKCGLSVICQQVRCLYVWLRRSPHPAQHVLLLEGNGLNSVSSDRRNAVTRGDLFSSCTLSQECRVTWAKIEHVTLPALIIDGGLNPALGESRKEWDSLGEVPKVCVLLWDSPQGPEGCLDRDVLVLLILFSISQALYQRLEKL